MALVSCITWGKEASDVLLMGYIGKLIGVEFFTAYLTYCQWSELIGKVNSILDKLDRGHIYI